MRRAPPSALLVNVSAVTVPFASGFGPSTSGCAARNGIRISERSPENVRIFRGFRGSGCVSFS